MREVEAGSPIAPRGHHDAVAGGFCHAMLPDYQGPVVVGGDVVLADAYDDVIMRTAWAERGFTVIDFPGGQAMARNARDRIGRYLRARASEAGLDFPESLSLGDYHRIEGLSDDAHLRIARWGVPFETFGLDADAVVAYVSDKVGARMKMFFLNDDPQIKDMCGVRVIRPRQTDHNPFHRDGWFENLRHAVTMWIPLVNCSPGSSLRVLPGSHRWPESEVQRTPEGVRLGKKKYKVPALIALKRPPEPVEPVNTLGRALLFSSYLIHGGGENRQADATRISMELRFVKDV